MDADGTGYAMDHDSSTNNLSAVAEYGDPAADFAARRSLNPPPAADIASTVSASASRPRILVLVGSIRPGSASGSVARLVMEELQAHGGNVAIFDPTGLPTMCPEHALNAKVTELRRLVRWSEGQVWISPEYHGGMSGLLKTQIDWIPVAGRKSSMTYGKALALMQVCGGQQSFNALNQMRLTARSLHLLAIPNQLSVSTALEAITSDGRFISSGQQERLIDICAELAALVDCTRQGGLKPRGDASSASAYPATSATA